MGSRFRGVKDMYIRIYLVHSRIGTYTFVLLDVCTSGVGAVQYGRSKTDGP